MNAPNQAISQERVTATINRIVSLFESEDVPQVIAIATFPPYDVPSKYWSLANKIIMMLAGTSDARGFAQWKKVGRWVRSGEKAFYILAPRMVKKCSDNEEEEKENHKEYILVGFVPVPVFRMEQTEGKELIYEKIVLPEFPLMDKAREWGIDVKGVAFQGDWYGYYRVCGDQEKIRLATPHEKTFFHELAHSAHRRVRGKMQGGQNPRQEIVAELSAQVLAQLVGTKLENSLGNSYRYIQGYAEKLGQNVGRACLSVLADIEKVLALILDLDTLKKEKKHEL